MKTILLAVAVLIAVPAIGQEIKHAPTMDVCRADIALWYSVEMATEYRHADTLWIRDEVPNRTDIARLSVREVTARMGEMYDCWQVSGNEELYFKAGSFYEDVFSGRAVQFVKRHGLWDQFLKEDATGKR